MKNSPNISTVQNSTNFYFIYYSFCTFNCMQTALNFKLMTPSTHINIEDLWFYLCFLLSVLATKGYLIHSGRIQCTYGFTSQTTDSYLKKMNHRQQQKLTQQKKYEDKKLILIHRVQCTRKGRKLRTEGPIIFHTLYFIIQIIIAACNSVYEMNQKYILNNKGNETFWKAEADRSSKYKNWWAVTERRNAQVWSNASWFSKQTSNQWMNRSTVCLTIKVHQVTLYSVHCPMWKWMIQMTTGV